MPKSLWFDGRQDRFDCVGGIIGIINSCNTNNKPTIIKNCTFTGKVVSEGDAGGIRGSGYDDGTAPNSPCVTIEDCKCSGASPARAGSAASSGRGGRDHPVLGQWHWRHSE